MDDNQVCTQSYLCTFYAEKNLYEFVQVDGMYLNKLDKQSERILFHAYFTLHLTPPKIRLDW